MLSQHSSGCVTSEADRVRRQQRFLQLLRRNLVPFHVHSIGAEHGGFAIDFGQAAFIEVSEVGTEPGNFAGAAGAVFAHLVKGGAPGLELCLHGGQLLAQGQRLGGGGLGLDVGCGTGALIASLTVPDLSL